MPSATITTVGADAVVGGYDHDFVQTTEKYNCAICKMVIRESRETDCGHRFCRSCLEQVRKNQNRASNFSCPVCKTALNVNLIYPSKAFDRDIQSLEVRCSQEGYNDSCQWSGELRALEHHTTEECEFTKVKCTNEGCSEMMCRRGLADHMDNVCGYTLFPCEYCSSKVVRCEKDSHTNMCPKWPLPCSKKCGKVDIARG